MSKVFQRFIRTVGFGSKPRPRSGPTRDALRARLAIELLEGRECPSTLDILGPSVPLAALPSGYGYREIESWVPAGGEHGAPYVVGGTPDNSNFALLVSTETANGLTWSAPIPSTHVNPNEQNPLSIDVNLIRSADGSPLILGDDKINGYSKATSWTFDQETMTLVPTLHPYPQQSTIDDFTYLIGGDSAGSLVAAASGADLAVDVGGVISFVSANYFGDDRYGGTIVGETRLAGPAYLTENSSGGWDPHTPALPSWSTGRGEITDISSHLMGGDLYNPNTGDSTPVIWDVATGAIVAAFDDPKFAGYTVNEIVDDQGVNVVLLGDGSSSYLWAEGWTAPRAVFGDILPALPAGETGSIVDFSSGGSLWLLADVIGVDGSSTYEVGSLATQVSGNDPPTDPPPPTVTGVTRLDATPTNAGVLHFQVQLSATVTGVDPSDFATSGTAASSIASVAGSGDSYVITVSVPASAAGTVGLNVLADGTIKDAAGDALDAGYTVTDLYTVDRLPPMVASITRLDSATTNLSDVRYTVAFSEPVSGVDLSDFALAKTGTLAANVAGVTGFGASYVVTVHIASGQGSISLSVLDDGTIKDAAGNPLGDDPSGPAYAVNRTAPSTATIAVNDGQAQRSMVTSVTVAFSEVVTLPANPAAAFRLVREGTNTPIGLRAAVSNAGGHTTVTLMFLGPTIVGGSLMDGSYVLSSVPSAVRDSAGNTLAGVTSAEFFRVYGDLDGNGVVSRQERQLMLRARGSRIGQVRYIAALDWNGDRRIGVIENLEDLIRFAASSRLRFRTPIYHLATLNHGHPYRLPRR